MVCCPSEFGRGLGRRREELWGPSAVGSGVGGFTMLRNRRQQLNEPHTVDSYTYECSRAADEGGRRGLC